MQILQQLSIPNNNNSTIPSSSPSAASLSTPFRPSPSAIRINSFWFSSLVLSLVTASIGILVKQWLREYYANEAVSPRAHFRDRYFRYVGLVEWQVFEIAAFLPFLLQIALALFFLGLSDFVRNLDPLVGWLVTGIIISWLIVYISSALDPLVVPQCPYKNNGVQLAFNLWKQVTSLHREDFPSYIQALSAITGILILTKIARLIPEFNVSFVESTMVYPI